LDLTSEKTIAQAARRISSLATSPRIILDATGFLHGDGAIPEKSWQQLDAAYMAKCFAINAIGPALLMKHLLP
jgi:NAD(P)-dependent dehydrogenase (short-subunit alcohol dehydrogenase family)